jgi:hypothetical protein
MVKSHDNVPRGFGVILTIALGAPTIAVIGSWCTQLFMKFPPRSAAAGITALIFMVASAAELIPVTIAITRLIRAPETREPRSYVFTVIGLVTLLPALATYLAVMLT